jgi:hypothetical protein
MKIDSSDEDENDSDSIRVNREFDSNEMNWSRQRSFRETIESGIQDREIEGLFSAESVTILIEPLRTTTRRSQNCVELDSSIVCLDSRDRFMTVKWFEKAVNIEWFNNP